MEEVQIRQKMQGVLDNLVQDVSGIRTGRAVPSMVEDVVISCYGGGSKLRLIELATITAPDAQTLAISPWDKSIIGEVRRGLEEANVGLTPVISGEDIRINLPPMTAQDRERYVKLLHQQLENGRVAVRMVRHEAKRDIDKKFEEKEISEDEQKFQEKRIQELTDEFVEKIDKAGKKKESELRTV